MKFETIQGLAPGELRRVLGALIGKHGSQSAAAQEMGVAQPTLANVMSGRTQPGRKFLDYLGLETRRVIVSKEGAKRP